MRHPFLLGNKQPQVLRELRGGHSLVWEVVLCSLPGAPSSYPGPGCLPMTAGIYGSPRVTKGVTAAAPGVWMLVVRLWQGVWLSHMPVSCGVFLLSHACIWARASPSMTGSGCRTMVYMWPSPRVTVATWLSFHGGLTAAQGTTSSSMCLSPL